ncbi:MAG TPA: haloacid dehalogenase-like hydrolase [Gemmatales bacterium]|nr:haloacid dehalogenase-like hydrolase [Gemmatales bacterium]HMP59053.1 haloacid dehalogenase-like hydrolase [Gemmatales bacterium]
MTAILFDIDGTLLNTGGAGKLAMQNALRFAFGLDQIHDGVPFAGRTDRSIGRDLLRHHGLPAEEQALQRLQDAYLGELPRSLERKPGRILPGIAELLRRLAEQTDVALGLLTGNLRRGAEVKLSYFGIDHYFAFGGFGDVHDDRDDVARQALAEGARHLGRELTGSACWVIGDTPLDVRCARAIGAQVLAVATGGASRAELAACQPDLLLDDLADPEPLLQRLA